MNITAIDRERGWSIFFWRKKKVLEAVPDPNPADEEAAQLEAARERAYNALQAAERAVEAAHEALREGRPGGTQEAIDAVNEASVAMSEWARLGGPERTALHNPLDAQCSRWILGEPTDPDARCPKCRGLE
jgi:flagellar hook-basal body complex protein FliE